MKATSITGILAAVGMVWGVSAGVPDAKAAGRVVPEEPTIIDVRPLLEARHLGDGLVPIQTTARGYQLWARVEQGAITEWMVTHSRLLERVLGASEEWRAPFTSWARLFFGNNRGFIKHPTVFLKMFVPWGEQLPDGLVPLRTTPGGLQLWAYVYQGQIVDGIVTHSEILAAALDGIRGWRYPSATQVNTQTGTQEVVRVRIETPFGPILWQVPSMPR